MSFPVTFQDFFGSVGRKKNFLSRKYFMHHYCLNLDILFFISQYACMVAHIVLFHLNQVSILSLGERKMSFQTGCTMTQVNEQIFCPVKRRNKWKDKYFTRKVSENFLGQGSWLWVGRVTGNDNIFLSHLSYSNNIMSFTGHVLLATKTNLPGRIVMIFVWKETGKTLHLRNKFTDPLEGGIPFEGMGGTPNSFFRMIKY